MKFPVFSLLVLAVLAVSSCQKGDALKDDVKKDDIKKDEGKETDKADCFKLVYPVSYIMPDGASVTGNNEEEVWTAMKAWYVAHPDSKVKPVFQYPVEIVFGDEIKTIQNEEEMILAKKACGDELTVCDWKEPQTTDGAVWVKYVVKDLVINDECGCPVAGFVKYTKNGKTAFMVDYGDGACDSWAFLTTCYDGNCESDKVKKCKIKLDCNPG